ncbi:D-apiose dehydrogenase [subsurface metagenome]
MQKVKFGVIGCGSIAEIAHFPSIKEIPEAELVAVCDTNEETAREAASKWKAKAYFTDYRKMLTRENLDAAIIATPNCFHRDQALAAAEAKVHVLVEKPMAITNKEAWDMVEGCKKAGIKLMVGCDRRFCIQNEYAKELVDQGVIGKVLMANAIMYEHWDLYQGSIAKTDFRLKGEKAGAAAVSDTGAHAIDLLTWLVGSEVKRVVGVAKRLAMPEDYTLLDDTVWILMEHKSGSYSCVTCNRFSRAAIQSTSLYGNEGSIMTSSDATTPFQTAPLAVFTDKDYNAEDLPRIIRDYRYPQLFWAEDLVNRPVSKRWVPIYPPRESNYARMIKHFVGCILEDKEPRVTGEDGAKAVEVMCAVFKSMETGGWVDLPLKEEVVPPYYEPQGR